MTGLRHDATVCASGRLDCEARACPNAIKNHSAEYASSLACGTHLDYAHLFNAGHAGQRAAICGLAGKLFYVENACLFFA